MADFLSRYLFHGFPVLHMAPPRMEAGGQDYVEGPGGRLRRGGAAGETSWARQGSGGPR